MANVDATRIEYDSLTPTWDLIRDCVAGSRQIKLKGDKYLPRPNPTDLTKENSTRYEQYVDRAVFYNVTSRTVAGLSGQVFKKDPLIDLPASIGLMAEDVDGGGVSLLQQSKKVLTDVLSYSRAGLFVDYPDTGGVPASQQQLREGSIRPSVLRYDPWDIINWRVRRVGGVTKLSLVVLSEEYVIDDDGFEEERDTMWRVLRLDEEGLYVLEEYIAEDKEGDYAGVIPTGKLRGRGSFVLKNSFMPTDAAGNRLDYIPFIFVGSVNNDPTPDPPLMSDMSVLNIAHYRNSADYEEAVFITGQPTPYFAGLTEDWVENVFKGKVQLGSRSAIPLPEGGSGGLLQVAPNSLPAEAMRHKEDQMIALGAKLIETSNVQRTATEVVIKDFGEHANLTTVSKNVSDAYKIALAYAQRYVNTSAEEIKFTLNTDFEVTKLDANGQAMVMSLWQGAAITKTEMRDILRRGGIATLTDEDYDDLIESEGPPDWAGAAGADMNFQNEGN